MNVLIDIFLFSRNYPLVVEMGLIAYCFYLTKTMKREREYFIKFRNSTDARLELIEDDRVLGIEIFLDKKFSYHRKNVWRK